MSSLAHSSLATRLRALTPARVGLGRTGVSQQTSDLLQFQQAHAQARDSVHARLDSSTLSASLAAISGSSVLRLQSAAPDRTTYLQRPDLGRKLDESSRASLAVYAHLQQSPCDLVVVVADGLSALAVERHVPPLLEEWLPQLEAMHLAPICIVEQGRVAIADEIGAALNAQMAVIFIGERPGLSSPDSLGAYITWQPQTGRTDAQRNCISNIRAEGLSYAQAAEQLNFYLVQARLRRLTGVALKFDSNLLNES